MPGQHPDHSFSGGHHDRDMSDRVVSVGHDALRTLLTSQTIAVRHRGPRPVGGPRDFHERQPERSGSTVGGHDHGQPGVVGARFILDGGPPEGRFSLVEHPIVARGMAAPVHLHTREDEYSFILEGRWGFWQGGNVAFAEPGDLVYKPRDVWHTFWNATDVPARLLEIISPAAFCSGAG
jgi:mannose-6-phosphate isomerase-like protein (cupin superfamily)